MVKYVCRFKQIIFEQTLFEQIIFEQIIFEQTLFEHDDFFGNIYEALTMLGYSQTILVYCFCRTIYVEAFPGKIDLRSFSSQFV